MEIFVGTGMSFLKASAANHLTVRPSLTEETVMQHGSYFSDILAWNWQSALTAQLAFNLEQLLPSSAGILS